MDCRGDNISKGIREVNVQEDGKGNYKKVSLMFGPHFGLNISEDEEGKVNFTLVATHHGFEADASEVDGELEEIIREVREEHPEKVTDSFEK